MEGRQQPGTVGSDHQSSGGSTPHENLQPGETAELLGAVDEQDVLDREAPKKRLPLHPGQPAVAFMKKARANSKPALCQSPGQFLQKRGLPAAMETHQGGAESESGETADQILPADRIEPVGNRLQALRGERVVPGSHG